MLFARHLFTKVLKKKTKLKWNKMRTSSCNVTIAVLSTMLQTYYIKKVKILLNNIIDNLYRY